MKSIAILMLLLPALLGCTQEPGNETRNAATQPKDSLTMKPSDRPSHYIGTVERWIEALECWRLQMQPHTTVPLPAIEPRSNIDELAELLARHPDLPRSYIDFLMAGGDQFLPYHDHESLAKSPDGMDSVWPPFSAPSNVGHFPILAPEDFEIWTTDKWDDPINDAYYRYDFESSRLSRYGELSAMLVVGEEANSGFHLLNPHHQSADGEWEAWLLHPKIPGARRYRTFAHLAAMVYTSDLSSVKELSHWNLYSFDGDWSKTCFAKIIEKDW